MTIQSNSRISRYSNAPGFELITAAMLGVTQQEVDSLKAEYCVYHARPTPDNANPLHYIPIGYYGRQKKPGVSGYRYPSYEKALKIIKEDLRGKLERKARKAQQSADDRQKAVQLFSRIEAGDMFYTSGGYDQTNVYFYQVIAKSGTATVKVREVKGDRTYDTDMSGDTIPIVNGFANERVLSCRLTERGLKVDHFEHAQELEHTVMCGVKVFSSKYWSSYG
jgi:hypothetical protein